MSEIRVGVRDLKARLSEYLRHVKSGQTIVITEHGRPVGRLLPAEQALEEHLEVLQAAGMVAWNGRKLGAISPAAVNRGDRQVSDLLVEMRE
jgi:prevent-host-death family protein